MKHYIIAVGAKQWWFSLTRKQRIELADKYFECHPSVLTPDKISQIYMNEV